MILSSLLFLLSKLVCENSHGLALLLGEARGTLCHAITADLQSITVVRLVYGTQIWNSEFSSSAGPGLSGCPQASYFSHHTCAHTHKLNQPQGLRQKPNEMHETILQNVIQMLSLWAVATNYKFIVLVCSNWPNKTQQFKWFQQQKRFSKFWRLEDLWQDASRSSFWKGFSFWLGDAPLLLSVCSPCEDRGRQRERWSFFS